MEARNGDVAGNYTSIGADQDIYINENGVFEKSLLAEGMTKDLVVSLPEVPSGHTKRIIVSAYIIPTQNSISVEVVNDTYLEWINIKGDGRTGYSISSGGTAGLSAGTADTAGSLVLEFIYCGKYADSDKDWWICRTLA